ncbi:MAG: cyclic nucleotide-binding domain-containing protein [Oscillochloridaceae bacterium]|nr:cyclic nucleotide-binding domain-containing protein [Chloroflexaceae bacterium]MDW8389390.1 cyclic nucleotide-binding domain-containing protein [Oscillochloridaceae bacterium]
MSARNVTPRISERVPARVAAQQQRREAAVQFLGSLDCLRGVPVNERARLLDLCVFRVYPVGATVLGQQKHSLFFFMVLSGTLQLRLRDKNGREVLMGILGRGDCCGEGPLFGDYFRQMSALAQSDCQLLQASLSELRGALDTLPRLAAALRQVYQRRLVECTLARVPLLGQLSPTERLALVGLLHPAHYARGSLILRQGSPADSLYLIESGQVAIEQAGQTIATLSEGDFFGEMALLTSRPHHTDVRALTPTDVLALPGAEFHRLLEHRPDLEVQLRAEVERRLKNGALMRNDSARARELQLVVTRGLLRGSHLFVRTPDLCPPGCRLCEEACLERHGQQRLHLNGVPLERPGNGDAERLDVLDVCRQCSTGPECVEACPEDAFERLPDGTLLISDRCTGCGACMPACPYDAITIRPLPGLHPGGGPLGARLRRLIGLPRRHPLIPLHSGHSGQRADKCDHCHGFADRACLSRCPTGSLRIVPVEELFTL